MKDMLQNLLGFIYSLSMGDYFFFIGTFLLIVLFIYIIYLIKCSDSETTLEDDLLNELPKVKKDSFDLEATIKNIEENYKPEVVKLTSYEEEQENNAIISYDELIKNKDKLSFAYDDEYEYDIPELKVKKFDLSNTSEIKIPENKLEVKLMSYDKEEEFLKTLRELQHNLTN